MPDSQNDAPKTAVSHLLMAAKIVGAVVTIGGASIAVAAWVFSAVMSERDNKIQELQDDISSLTQSIDRLSSQLDDSEERFTNLRIAMELLNARLELRTTPEGAPASPVRVRVRPHPTTPPLVVPTSTGVPPLVVGDPPPSGVRPPPFGRILPPAPPEERVFHTDHEAEAAFDEALADVGGPT